MVNKKKQINKLPIDHIYRKIAESKLTLNGGWREFTFNFVSELHSVEKEALWGYVDFESGIISLNTDGTDHQACCVTLLHELFHIIFSNCGLPSDVEKDGVLRQLSNEELTELTSTSFVSLVRNNKELFQLIINNL